MREHVPFLLVRAGALVRHVAQLSHGVARFFELGFVRAQSSPRLLGRTSEASSKEMNTDDSSHKEEISENRELSGPQSKKLIISVHIPKTGGTTFLEVLKEAAQEILYLDYGSQVFSPSAVYRHGKRVEESFESITNLESLPGRSVVHGHFRTGKYLPKFPNASYVTWLRDPVERLASHYYFWQRAAHDHGFMDNPLCNRVISQKMSLVEFAELEEARNVQHRFLAPVGVKYFDFIGITEEYSRSIALFQKLICPEINITPQLQNRNPNRRHGFYKLEPGIRERILELNKLDSDMYLEGLHRFRTLCDELGV